MGKVEKLEDLIAWQKARCLVREVYKVTGHGPFEKDYSLKDQIRRAAVSVMSILQKALNGSITENSISF